MNQKRNNFGTLCTFVCAVTIGCTAYEPLIAQVETGSAIEWLDQRGVAESATSPVSVAWNESPLRSLLDQFAAKRQRAILLDRRIDPTMQQSFVLTDQSTEQVVWQVAEANGLGVARVGELLYVGPQQSAANLPFVIEDLTKQLKKLPKDLRSKWSRRSEIRWSHATTTEEIQQWFELQYGIKFDRSLPHDVWPQADWPPLSTTQQLSLVLAGFDGSFRVSDDGVSVTMIRMPKPEQVAFRFRRGATVELAALKSAFPKIKFSGSRTVSAKGTSLSIAKLKSWLVTQQRVKMDNIESRTYDLDTSARRGDLLATIASQTGRELEIDEALGDGVMDILNQQVKLKLSKASLDTLLKTCLQGSDLSFQLTDTKLKIIKP